MNRDGERLRIWISTIAALGVIGAAGFVFWYRAVYNVMSGQSASGRVHWCGRDYDEDGSPVTRQQAVTQAGFPLRAVGSYPPLAWSSDALLAAAYPAGQQAPTSCATLVYLRTGPDAYKPYSLDGGP